jgi:hypothetical protein
MSKLAALAVAVTAAAAVLTGAPKDASALMMMQEESLALEGGGGGGGYYAPAPVYANKIVYLHGRSMRAWPSAGKLPTGADWNHVILSYNGDTRLTNSTSRSQIKEAINTNCNAPNQCVIVAYSSGVNRMLLALSDLKAEGRPATKVLWVTATASAAGGSELATKATRGFSGFLAKLFGARADVDYDITPNAARGTFGYTQNNSPAAVYHAAGNKDYCKKKKILFVTIKLCGKKYLPGRFGDGAVGPHSACGLTTVGAFSSCYGTKYTNRYAQQDALYYSNHEEMVAVGVKLAATRLATTATISIATTSEDDGTEAEGDVSYDDGDDVAVSPTRFGQTAALADTDTYAPNEHQVRTCAYDCGYASPTASTPDYYYSDGSGTNEYGTQIQ